MLGQEHYPVVHHLWHVGYSMWITAVQFDNLRSIMSRDHLNCDTQLFFSFHPPFFDSNITHHQNALQQISSWMAANLLTLNSSKTEFLLIGLSKQLAKIHNSSLSTTHSARNLGFIFDEHLSFSDQISTLSTLNPAIITFVNFVASVHLVFKTASTIAIFCICLSASTLWDWNLWQYMSHLCL